MAPPTYGDLGKSARDVFGKGFHFGLVKLDVKVREDGCYNTIARDNIFPCCSMELWLLFQGKSSSGVQLTSGGVTNQETGKVFDF